MIGAASIAAGYMEKAERALDEARPSRRQQV